MLTKQEAQEKQIKAYIGTIPSNEAVSKHIEDAAMEGRDYIIVPKETNVKAISELLSAGYTLTSEWLGDVEYMKISWA
jgi:hypothetical protein